MTVAASDKQTRFSLVAESTRGTTPSNPTFLVIPRLPSSMLNSVQTFERSNIIRSDRQGGKQVGGVKHTDGTIHMAVAREATFDALLESALSGAFGSLVSSAAITGSFAASGKTFTRAAGNFLTDTIANRLQIGDLVFLGGASVNGTTLGAAITDAVTTSITVTSGTPLPTTGGVIKIDSEIIIYASRSGTTLSGCTRGAYGTTAISHLNNATVVIAKTIANISALVLTFNEAVIDENSITITFATTKKQLIAGVARKFFSMEDAALDIGVYSTFKGMEVNNMNLNIPTSGECSAEFALIGVSCTRAQETGSPTYTDAANATPCAGSVQGARLLVDGAAFSAGIESFTANITNSRAAKFTVGSSAAVDIEQGDFDVTMSFPVYFVSNANRAKFDAGTRFALVMEVRDQDNNHGYRFIAPKVVFTNGPSGVSGQTRVETMSAFCEYDAGIGAKFMIEAIIGS